MFASILGQEPAIQVLSRALKSGLMHHAYRLEGPSGVGKMRAALAFAQALVCSRGERVACGECSACQRAVNFSETPPHIPLHPDVVLLERGLYREILGQAEATGISIEQVRRMVLERVALGPHEGRALVFIIKEAEELTPQAANSLLKTLEEPGPNIHFVLVTSRPNRLLDTIRSRTLPVRFGLLPDAVLSQILSERELSTDVVPFAQGSAELALELADPELVQEREAFVSAALAAVNARDLAPALKFAESQKLERDVLRRTLAFFAQKLALSGQEQVGRAPHVAELYAHQHAVVLATLADLERNQQPTLALEALIYRLRQLGQPLAAT